MVDFDLPLETLKSALSRAGMAVARFGTAIVVARLLDPALFGAVYLLLRMGTVASNIVIGWADGVKTRFASGDIGKETVAGELLSVAGLWSVLVVCVTVTASGPLEHLTGLKYASIFLATFVVVESASVAIEKYFEANGRLGVGSGFKASRYVLAFPLQVGLVIANYGPAGFVGGFAAGTLITLPVAAHIMNVWPTLPSSTELRRGWEFARYAVPNALIGTTYTSLDVFLLSVLLSTTAAGYYEAAWVLTMPGMFVATAAASGLVVKVSGALGRENDPSTTVEQTIGYSSFFSLPILAGALVVGSELVILTYGSAYRPATTLLAGLALHQTIRAQTAPLLQTTYGLNRPNVVTQVTLLATIINVLLGVVLVIQIGPVGVVGATLLAETIRYVWLARTVTAELPSVNLFPRSIRVQILSATLMGFVVYIMALIVDSNSILGISGIIGTGAVTYASLVLILDQSLRHRIEARVGPEAT
ncbi:oligosaccharide flippase family protein [Natrinema salinisoli]|uniref:oligosaccharide flippase family protein n=1 Tax=Natrinema salinisoli TaxID=2878535 RepID=UPI001CF0CD1F|nr:oligosaccharide flippase family protein [Natrinema salinisoli]